MANESKKGVSKRRIIRCTFQADASTRTGKFFDFLSSSLDEKTPRELVQEASEVYWMPIHLVYQYKAGLLTDEEHRQRLLLALFQLQAWSSYCQQFAAVGPVAADIHAAFGRSFNNELKVNETGGRIADVN